MQEPGSGDAPPAASGDVTFEALLDKKFEQFQNKMLWELGEMVMAKMHEAQNRVVEVDVCEAQNQVAQVDGQMSSQPPGPL